MKSLLHSCDDVTRRDLAKTIAKTCLGVSVMSALAPRGFAAPFEGSSKAKQAATAKRVIYLYMSGGMTHLDTFGCVPGADTMGGTKTIPTSADGVQIGELLPHTAKMMHRGAIINSLSSTQGAHAQGNYFQHTSYTMRGATRHPTMGAWMQKFQGKGNVDLPGSVIITSDSKHPGGGFFEAACQPLILNDPARGLQNSHRPGALSESDFDYRLGLSAKLDQGFQQAYSYKNVKAYADVYKDAIKVMKSEDLDAFDLSKESPETHAEYGDGNFAQGCLLARRLVEHGVRFVEVNLGGWDMHQDIGARLPERCGDLDQALGTLLTDLQRRGLLDDKGIEVTENKVSVPDFNATIAYALGLPLDLVLYSSTKRPFTVTDKGQPITSLFA
jgi:hypothetical protein